MSKDELIRFKSALEDESKYCPLIKKDYPLEKESSYWAYKYIRDFDVDSSDKLISHMEEEFKSQIEKMVGTPYEYVLDAAFDFGPICKDKFAIKYADFDMFNDCKQLEIYNSSLLLQCIPGKIAIKLGNIHRECYYDGIIVPSAMERINYPSDDLFVVDFNTFITKLSEKGYELVVKTHDVRTPVTDFDTMIDCFKEYISKHVIVSVDFRKEKEIEHSPKTYTNSPSTKKTEDNQ